MSDYTGKTCPFCKGEIKEGDEVMICPACGIPHHRECWDENKGCTTFGCSEQHYEAQGTNISDVCVKCGAPLGDGQEFCPKCGTPKGGTKANVCGKCGTELADGQEFCPKCGQKSGLAVDSSVAAKIGQLNAVIKKKNKKPFIFGGVGVAIVAVIIIIATSIGSSGPDFQKLFGEYASEKWCTIASDGSYMKLDTNPRDLDDDDLNYSELLDFYAVAGAAMDAVETANDKLGFPNSLLAKMNETTWSQGRQTDENDKVKVSWTYHPDKGLEVMYENKK